MPGVEVNEVDLNLFLRLLTAVLAIIGILSPVFAGWALWRLAQTFATKKNLRGAVLNLKNELKSEMKQLETDFRHGIALIEQQQSERHRTLLDAINNVRESLCKDINGIGERLTAVQSVASIATNRADEADNKVDLLTNDLKHINEHGTIAVAALRNDVAALTSQIETFNRLVERGVITISKKGE